MTLGLGHPGELAIPRRRDRWTMMSLALFLLGLSMVGSVFADFRIEIRGLLLHPYLFPLSFLSLFALPRLNRLPPRIFLPLLGFLMLFGISTLPARGALGENLKMLSAAATIVVLALLIRRRADFQACSLGLSLAAGIMGARGLLGGEAGVLGIDPIAEIANRNAFSLYTLPSLLIASFVALDTSVRPYLRLLATACSLITVVAIFSTANRSGWLGALLIAVMLYGKGRRIRAILFVTALALISYGLLIKFSSITVLEHRVEQTIAGYHSDRLRRVLFFESVEVGLEHPIIGVSPQKLPFELARRLSAIAPEIDAHNLFGHLMGGSGVPATLCFLLFGQLLWFRRRGVRPPPQGELAHRLLRMMLVLFFIRGMFSREIIFAPAFCIGIGLCLGYCLMSGTWDPPATALRQVPVDAPDELRSAEASRR